MNIEILQEKILPNQQIHLNRYLKFIESRKERLLHDCYIENHHIIPKALGGNNTKENLIQLSEREHYIAHLMLWKAFGGKMTYAFNLMNNRIRNNFSSRLYERLRVEFKLQYAKDYSGINSPMYNRKFSEEHKQKISIANKNRKFSKESIEKANQTKKDRYDKTKHHMYGKHHSKATKEKIGIKSKNKVHSKETRIKISNSLTGKQKNWSEDGKNRLIAHLKSRTGELSSAYGKKGDKSYSFKGYWHTPWGVFGSAKEASLNNYCICSKSSITKWCQNSECIINIHMAQYNKWLKQFIGKTFKEIGFYFEEIKND